MHFGLFYKNRLFNMNEYCSCIVKTESFSRKKGVKYSEMQNFSEKVSVFWAYVIEENKKVENLSLLKLINEIEAEREEVKYYKNKMKIKLMKIKEKSKACKLELERLIRNFEPIIEFCTENEQIPDDSLVIIAERKKINDQTLEMLYKKVKIEKEIEKLKRISNQYE